MAVDDRCTDQMVVALRQLELASDTPPIKHPSFIVFGVDSPPRVMRSKENIAAIAKLAKDSTTAGNPLTQDELFFGAGIVSIAQLAAGEMGKEKAVRLLADCLLSYADSVGSPLLDDEAGKSLSEFLATFQ